MSPLRSGMTTTRYGPQKQRADPEVRPLWIEDVGRLAIFVIGAAEPRKARRR